MTNPIASTARFISHFGIVIFGAVSVTLLLFLVLPLMQTIAHKPADDMLVRQVDIANLPPPPPPPPEQEEEEDEPEDEQPPELEEDVQPLDLSQLELALNPGYSGDGLGGDFAVKIGEGATKTEDMDALFDFDDLDQAPQLITSKNPTMSPQMRRRAPATVYIIFVVDKRGRVENAIVQSSTDPIFEAPALAAIKQWKFNPGMHKGEPVRFRMRVPITFPKGE